MIDDDDALYLDVYEMFGRGWTEALIQKHLGTSQRWKRSITPDSERLKRVLEAASAIVEEMRGLAACRASRSCRG